MGFLELVKVGEQEGVGEVGESVDVDLIVIVLLYVECCLMQIVKVGFNFLQVMGVGVCELYGLVGFFEECCVELVFQICDGVRDC